MKKNQTFYLKNQRFAPRRMSDINTGFHYDST